MQHEQIMLQRHLEWLTHQPTNQWSPHSLGWWIGIMEMPLNSMFFSHLNLKPRLDSDPLHGTAWPSLDASTAGCPLPAPPCGLKPKTMGFWKSVVRHFRDFTMYFFDDLIGCCVTLALAFRGATIRSGPITSQRPVQAKNIVANLDYLALFSWQRIHSNPQS